jgi:DNA-binding transcriptional LysR family regulator
VDLIAALRTFLRVAEVGSFSAVAEERGVTQPAVSRQLSALEEHFGTRLVQRSTHAVTLTEEGRELVPTAQQLVDSADALQETTGRRRRKAVGRVRLSVPVPPARPVFQRQARCPVEEARRVVNRSHPA